MFKHYINKFFNIHDRELWEKAKKHIELLEDQNRDLRLKMQAIDIQKPRDVPVSGFDSTECEPVDSKERMSYIADVNQGYSSFLKDKIRVSVAEIREELSRPSGRGAADLLMTREQYDFYLRGMEGMAWKMNDWCIQLEGERRSILQEEENNK